MENARQVIIDAVADVYSRYVGLDPYKDYAPDEAELNNEQLNRVVDAALSFDMSGEHDVSSVMHNTKLLTGEFPLGETEWLASLSDVELGIYGVRMMLIMKMSVRERKKFPKLEDFITAYGELVHSASLGKPA